MWNVLNLVPKQSMEKHGIIMFIYILRHIISSYLIWVDHIPIISPRYLHYSHYITIRSPFGLVYLQYHAISLAPALPALPALQVRLEQSHGQKVLETLGSYWHLLLGTSSAWLLMNLLLELQQVMSHDSKSNGQLSFPN